jgi:ABC-type bacteriocin/lantibiotic exporter with double-glycine peptidase domain
MNAFKNRDNTRNALVLLIKKIKVTAYTIDDVVLEHPDYPSMLSLSDSLTSWKIPNQALRLDKESCNLKELPTPFVAHVKTEGGQYFVVDEIARETVFYNIDKKVAEEMSKENFLDNWDGIILYAEKDVDSGESNYSQASLLGIFNELRLPFLLAMLLSMMIYLGIKESSNISYLLLLIINSLGVMLSIFLLIQSVDVNNPLIQNLCVLGRKNDCNAILKSDEVKVNSWLNWSEVGFFYFSGLLLCLLVSPECFTLLA